jgi:hypothetical protein
MLLANDYFVASNGTTSQQDSYLFQLVSGICNTGFNFVHTLNRTARP